MVRGGEHQTLSVHLPAASLALVIAGEQGVDVTLEVTDTAQRVVGHGDSPVPRSGVQAVALKSASAADYSIVLTSKDGAGVSGQVQLRVVTVPLSVVAGSCAELQQQIADADGLYVSGLVASRKNGSSPRDAAKPGPNAAQNSKASASAYAAVAARLSASQPGSRLLAQVEHAAAAVYYTDLSEWSVARRYADRAATDYAANHDAYDNARAQALSAAAQMEIAVSLPASQGSATDARPSSVALGAAREQLSRVATYHAGRGESYDQAQAINNRGLAYYYEGRNEDAIVDFQRALQLYQQLADKVRISQVSNNIALAEYTLGHSATAALRYSDALRNLSAAETPQPYAFILNNLGLAHFELGNYDAALRELSQALELWRAAQNQREQARSLQWIGSVYDAVGDQDQALDYYRAALALRAGNVDPRGRVTTLRATANLTRNRGDAVGALKLHEEALALAATPAIRSRLIVQIAMDLQAQGRKDDALQRLQGELALPGRDPVTHAMLLLQRARLVARVDQQREVQRDLREALQIFEDYELTSLEFDAWMALARSQRSSGDASAALASTDRALARAELLRVQSANPELRATLLQPLRPAYDLKISLLAEQYFARHDADARDLMMAALATAELSRSRALDDLESLDMSAGRIPPSLLARRADVLHSLATERNQLEVRLEHATVDDARVTALRAGIAEGRRQLTLLDAQLAALAGVRRGESQRSPLMLSAAANQLPTDVALVEYWVGAEQSFAWVLTRSGVTMTALPPGARINQAAVSFHASLSDIATRTQSDRLKLGAELYDLIVKPIAPQLVNAHRIVLAPDDALHYVSFAALRSTAASGDRFLVQDHDVSVIPSIAAYSRQGRPVVRSVSDRQLLVVADPVYQASDSRVAMHAAVAQPLSASLNQARDPLRAATTDRDLQRLPGTASEARAIAALLPPNTVDVLDGLDATRANFLAASLERYRLIHVATHGLVDTQIPQLSSLMLSTRDRQGRPIDGRVMAADFMTLRLSADVVVLSACDTALGKNIVGEGLVGLRYVILARGARAVVASLWAVPDQIGARLMTAFYQAMIRDHAQPSHALCSAMRELLAAQVVDPALWAAFDLTLRDASV